MAIPQPPQTTAYPEAPQRGESEAVFIPKANAFVAALDPRRIELQSLADYTYARAVDVETLNAQSVQAAADAVDAAQLAAVNSRIYPDTASGVAGTAEGEYFSVPGPDADDYLTLYRVVSGAATVIDTYPNKQAVIDVLASVFAELSSNATGSGSDDVAHTGTTDTVTQALDKRTIYVGSVAELEALSLPAGTAIYLAQDGRAGEFVVKTGTPLSDPQKGIYIVLANGNYAERRFSGPARAEWYGLKGDGTTDDTTAVQAALDANFLVTIDAGRTPRITSTVTVPSQTKLEFLGGHGNLELAPPSSYFIKDAAMTTDAVLIETRGWMYGGGVLGESGNTGDGIKLGGNLARISYSQVYNCGNDGIRAGYDDIYVNCNSCTVEFVKSYGNGRHGIYWHDGVGAAGATSDTNAGTLLHCEAAQNGGDGIKLGRAWWMTVINPLTEGNGGYGMHLSGTIEGTDTVQECRYPSVFGGDYNEGNTLGSLNFDCYAGCLYLASANQSVIKGGLINSYFVGPSGTEFPNLTLKGGNNALVTEGNAADLVAVDLKNRAISSNGQGTSIRMRSVEDREAALIKAAQRTTNIDELAFYVNISGTTTKLASADGLYPGFVPGQDGGIVLGSPSLRWGQIYSTGGTISTSDAREKQQARDLSEAETACAKELKGRLKAFKFNDAVEKKGDGARWHFGVLAQEIAEVFKSHGLDADEYGMFCYDEWPEETGKNDEVTTPAGNRYGVRYDELMCFIVAAI